MAITPYLLVVHPDVPVRNLSDFVKLAKDQGAKMNTARHHGPRQHAQVEKCRKLTRSLNIKLD